MACPQGMAVHQPAARLQGVDGRVYALARLGAGQDNGGIKMTQDGVDRGVRHVVRRNVDRLHRRDGPQTGGKNPLLHLSHFGGEGGLVTDGGRHAPEEAGNLAARLHETKDIVHDEQDLFLQGVAQILGIGERGESDPEAHPG